MVLRFSVFRCSPVLWFLLFPGFHILISGVLDVWFLWLYGSLVFFSSDSRGSLVLWFSCSHLLRVLVVLWSLGDLCDSLGSEGHSRIALFIVHGSLVPVVLWFSGSRGSLVHWICFSSSQNFLFLWFLWFSGSLVLWFLWLFGFLIHVVLGVLWFLWQK